MALGVERFVIQEKAISVNYEIAKQNENHFNSHFKVCECLLYYIYI